MADALLISLLLGVALAQSFRVFVLAPIALLGCGLIAEIDVAQQLSTGSIILDCVLVVACMQLGYLAGALIAIPQEEHARHRHLRN